MGYGSYTASDWQKLKTSRKLTNTQSVTEVFKEKICNPKFDPRYIGTRECFDSEDHPNTTPIVVGLDVTGSMGYLAVEIATKALNELIMKLYSTGSVTDPALMCAAYGDYWDEYPLQVTQFESDIRIAEQLLEIYFENGGRGMVMPTLLWHFLSQHTNIDAVRKRGEKGFVFTIGDKAMIREDRINDTVKRVIGDDIGSATRDMILQEVEKKFHVFHILIDGDENAQFMEGRKMIIKRNQIDCIPEIIISTIRLQKGMNMSEILSRWDELKQPAVRAAISQLRLWDTGKEITL